ncbi:MAG TPA: response regulator, partial [Anaeromyxobacteraceae bacterium]|nr:response regulator [Anaeromyxobacteraceae bacterium]
HPSGKTQPATPVDAGKSPGTPDAVWLWWPGGAQRDPGERGSGMLLHESGLPLCQSPFRSGLASTPALAGRVAAAPLILVVDDDDDIRDLIAEILSLEGYSVVSAMHGVEALERLRETRPGLIILDLMMPVMDGPTFIAAKCRDPAIADIPVLALTASPCSQVAGAALSMRKPFDLDRLLESVTRCIASEHAAGEYQGERTGCHHAPEGAVPVTAR